MKYLKLCVTALLIGVGVALVYLVFEDTVQFAIGHIWDDWLASETHRGRTFVATVVLGMLFFALKHVSDQHQAALRTRPVRNLVAILLVGFASLLAGATLGPEAILMPSALIVGRLIGRHHYPSGSMQLFGFAGIVALFVAFFDALWGGLLGFFVARGELTEKLTPVRLCGLVLAALGAYGTLVALSPERTFAIPHDNFLTLTGVLLYALGLAAGVVLHGVLSLVTTAAKIVQRHVGSVWYVHGLLASVGIGVLYVVGGYEVQFTGNTMIESLFESSAQLGVWTLVWLALVKTVAVAWSQTMGYRGGPIFPLMFAGSAIAAAATLYASNFSPLAMALAVLIGALVADQRLHPAS